MENTSKFFIIILVLIFSIFINLFSCAGVKQNDENKKPEELKIENIDLKKIRDGEYIGKYNININSARVNVLVKDGAVLKIEILKHYHGPGYGADNLIEEIIKKQTLKVDAVAGATKSSTVLIKAVENALKQAMFEEE
jgi:uncharacterized protein with FMN-binding domain